MAYWLFGCFGACAMTWVVGRRFWCPTSQKHLADAEANLLRDVRTPGTLRMVPIRYGTNASATYQINTWSNSRSWMTNDGSSAECAGGITRQGARSRSERTLVICSGYGAGLAFWAPTLDQLADAGLTIYVLDWLGTGRSSRPDFPIGNSPAAHDFFVDSLEEWRKSVGLDSFTLMGHSLGAYLSTHYAMRYNSRVQHLILASPCGIPPAPAAVVEGRAAEVISPNAPWWLKLLLKGWEWNFTPHWFVRALGPLGPYAVRKGVNSRFGNLSPETRDRLANYIYHTWSQRGSGEYAMNALLYPLAFAREPLMEVLPTLSLPISFIYGEHDWMDVAAARSVQSRLQVQPVLVEQVASAGHHIYFDNPRHTVDLVLQALSCDLLSGEPRAAREQQQPAPVAVAVAS
eukprot:gnl/Spiro4/28152_TR13928_c0_g1_i1.p1 gnl/Spiro4/28152_TR13928_c0_g1~~gnl/Spiro4/28152_TR13928_c0_g1_i1.p1  ORF type:complete len:403 (+),score=66.35 gnl/Spiro4/28152_TR13928_c0_g1_i1:81-1289(+)